MTWLAIRPFLPYILAFTLGFSGAWKIQDYRITGIEQDHTQYRQDQTRLQQEAINAANVQRDKADKAYELAVNNLNAANRNHDTFKRCVAAGRCGVQQPASWPATTLPPSTVIHDSRQDAIFAPAGSAETLANECAETTLTLNMLQQDIEGQKGY